MQEIEVEVSPVRIIGQPTAIATERPQNEVKIIVLKYKIVIPKLEKLEDGLEYIIPDRIDLKIPDEYVGYEYFPLRSGVLSNIHTATLKIYGDRLLRHLQEQDYEQDVILTITPNFDNVVTNEVTHILQTQSIYGVAEFSEVPTLFINKNGQLVSRADLIDTTNDDIHELQSLFDRLRITYKGKTLYSDGYGMYGLPYSFAIDADYTDGLTKELWSGNRAIDWIMTSLSIDNNNLPSAMYFVFKHNEHKSRVKIFDINNQSKTASPEPVIT